MVAGFLCNGEVAAEREMTNIKATTGENIGMFSKSLNDRDNYIYPSLSEKQVTGPVLNKFPYPGND